MFVRGEGSFVADRALPGDAHLAFVRAAVPWGRIAGIDVSAAAALPGVLGVWTGADLPECGSLQALTVPDPVFAEAFHFEMAPVDVAVLAADEILYVGQPLAVVAAVSRAVAEDAVTLVDVDIDERGPSLGPAATCASLAYHLGSYTPAPDDVRVALDLRIGRQTAVPMETRGVRAEPLAAPAIVHLATSTQVPHLVRRAICEATGWPVDGVVVEVPDVGGGFGTKANVYPEELVVPAVAVRLGCPAIWVEDRVEYFQAAAQGRDQAQHVELVVGPDGRARHFALEFSIDIGSSSLWTAGMLANTAIHVLGPYRLPSVQVSGRAHLSHKAPAAQYRGAGRPEACFAVERALDAAARTLGLDGAEIRRRNLRGPDELPCEPGLPYRDGIPILFDGCDWLATFEQAVGLLEPDDHDLAARVGAHEVLGWGSSCFVEATGRGPYEMARVRLDADRGVEVTTGAASSGQGHATTFARVAAEAIGIPEEAVHVTRTSTADIADGVGSFASRSAVVGGNAVHLAATRLRATLLAATDLADGPWTLTDGVLSDGEHRVSVAELLASVAGLDVLERYEPGAVTWTMAAHVAAVALDVETGFYRVIGYAVADEAGRPLDHDIVVGQVYGGVAQGIGGATLEATTYADDFQPTSVNFVDYHVPTTYDVPPIELAESQIPTANALGVRGVGESGTIGSNAAIAAAVDDALERAGVDVGTGIATDTPIRPAELRKALATAAGGAR